MKSQFRAFLILALIALVIAILRFFMEGWVAPLGISTRIGSLFASLTILLLVGLFVLFVREGLAAGGRYVRAATWFVPLAAWCEILVIAGILLTARTGATTYYSDTMQRPGQAPPIPTQHALMHAIAFVPIAAIGLLLGAIIYWLSKRGRPGRPAVAASAAAPQTREA
ncbi:MAG: hypothetical protein ACRD3D_14635 [Terriglobia bacterium]